VQARITIGILIALAIWAGLDWATYEASAQSGRVCRPLIIGGKPCGKLCHTGTGFIIRGCKPLNKLIRT
jgi:hypothetical protein